MYTEILKDHHANIYEKVATIHRYETADSVQLHAEELASNLARLAGLISIHLAAEDKFLYPNLIKSPDENVRATAKSFDEEMGGLAKTFNAYVQKYNTTSKIQQDVDSYLAATKETIGALEQRLKKEDAELYPLIQE